jgi:hypothetical protein
LPKDFAEEAVRNVDAESCAKDVPFLAAAILLQAHALTPSRASDLYLLALIAAKGARLATFDSGIPAEVVAGCTAALEIIRLLRAECDVRLSSR